MLDLIDDLISNFRETNFRLREKIEGLRIIFKPLRDLQIMITSDQLVFVNKYYNTLTNLLEFFMSH